jgi:hypothetical protein
MPSCRLLCRQGETSFYIGGGNSCPLPATAGYLHSNLTGLTVTIFAADKSGFTSFSVPRAYCFYVRLETAFGGGRPAPKSLTMVVLDLSFANGTQFLVRDFDTRLRRLTLGPSRHKTQSVLTAQYHPCLPAVRPYLWAFVP